MHPVCQILDTVDKIRDEKNAEAVPLNESNREGKLSRRRKDALKKIAPIIPFFISLIIFKSFLSPTRHPRQNLTTSYHNSEYGKASHPAIHRHFWSRCPNAPHAPPHPPSTICRHPPSPDGRIPCVRPVAQNENSLRNDSLAFDETVNQ